VVDTNFNSGRQNDEKYFFAKNHFLSIKSWNSSKTSVKTQIAICFFFVKRKEEVFWEGYESFLRIIGPLAETS
jgi:hypothetical protein